MVSIYVKALIITLVIFIGNFFFVKYIDDSRATDLQRQLQSSDDELQSSRLLLLYMQSFNSTPEICPLLENRTAAQVNRLYTLLRDLQYTSSANTFADTSELKTRYIISNAELLLYAMQMKNTCANAQMEPVLYFYPDKQDCVECRAQAQILDDARDSCTNIRIFAFPTDLDISVVDALKARYKIDRTPAIVVNEQTYYGITSQEKLLSLVPCLS